MCNSLPHRISKKLWFRETEGGAGPLTYGFTEGYNRCHVPAKGWIELCLQLCLMIIPSIHSWHRSQGHSPWLTDTVMEKVTGYHFPLPKQTCRLLHHALLPFPVQSPEHQALRAMNLGTVEGTRVSSVGLGEARD